MAVSSHRLGVKIGRGGGLGGVAHIFMANAEVTKVERSFYVLTF